MAIKQITINEIRRGDIKVEDSRVSQRQITIENSFKKLLNETTQFILNRIGLQRDATIDTIMQDFTPIVRESARSTIGSFYDLGAIYSAVVAGKMHFSTETDIINIKKLTDDFVAKFFQLTFKYLWRERERNFSRFANEILSLTNQATSDLTRKPLLLKNNIKNLVTTTATRSINDGITSKTQQLINYKDTWITRKAALKDFEFELLKSNQSTLAKNIQHQIDLANEKNRRETIDQLIENEFTQPQALSSLVVWVTAQDDKVCFQYCRPLEGETFDINDPNTPIPPDDVHPNCRCRLFNINESGNALFDVF